MNPYVCEVSCEVCGEGGMATPRVAACAWTVGVRHADPAVCADNLRIKARKLEEREKALKEKESC